MHRAVATGLIHRMRTESVAPVELFEDIAASEIARARHGGATLTDDEASVGVANTWGRLTDKAVRFAGGYGKLVAPTITPVAVERRVTVADVVPGALLRGTIDVIDRLADGSEVIRDDKTTERMPRADAAERSQQLTMYDLLYTAQRGDHAAVHEVSLDYLVLNERTGDVATRRLTSHRGPRDRSAIIARVDSAVKAVNAGVFLPANPETDWWCSAKWCEYWADCPFAIHGAKKLDV